MARDFIERLKFLIQADSKGLKKGLREGAKEAKKFTSILITTFDKAGAKTRLFVEGIGGVFAGLVVKTAMGLYDLTKAGLDYAASLEAMSQRTDVSVEDLSTLGHAAILSGANIETLEDGLTDLSTKLADAREPGSKFAIILKDLGVKIEDSEKKARPLKDILFDIADAFAESEDGATKLAAAQELLGGAGAQLIPFLNNGAEGLRAMQEEARKLGLEISTKTAKQSAQFAGQLDKLKGAISGVGLALLKNLAPSLTRIGAAFVSQTKKGGLLEGALNAIGAAAVEAAGGIDTTAAGNLKKAEGELERINGLIEVQEQAAIRGKSAIRLMLEGWAGIKTNEEYILALDEKREVIRAKISSLTKLAAAQAKAQEAREARINDRLKNRKQIVIADPAVAQKAEDERKKALADAEAKAKSEASAVNSLARQLTLIGELSLLERTRYEVASGAAKDFTEATKERLLALAAEVDAKKAILATDRQAELLTQRRSDALAIEVERIRESIRTEQELKTAELARIEELAVLGQISSETQQLAIEEIEERYKSLNDTAKSSFITIAQFGKEAATSAQSSFQEFLFNPTEDGFNDMVSSWASSLQKMAAEALTQQIFGKLLGGAGGGAGGGLGGLFGFASGGEVHGPGSSTSDSILARLSAGEYVVRAAAVRSYGAPFFEAINRMKFPGASGLSVPRGRSSLRFAEGGLVTEGAGAVAKGGDLTIANIVDREMFDQVMASKKGETVVINHIQNNASEIKRLLAG